MLSRMHQSKSFLLLAAIGVVVWSLTGVPTNHAAEPAGNTKPPIDNYEPGPDSKPQAGVPKGKTFSFKFDRSKIYPGTAREISVYVPAQYKADKPACVYVGFDNLGFNAATVFDNLINKGDMPVTIGIGVSSGTVPSADGKTDPRLNRSCEFDGLDDSLARCVVEEIFPEVEKHKTPDGLMIKLSADPNDRCTGGGSTGGIAAFTCAWQRPDQFRRVFSAIGTFVDMRGGDRYPVLVRETEPKPIRVFQQDGENDEWMGGPEVGDWWIGNQYLDRSLEFAGYEHAHSWGDGPHSGKHGTAVFPDAMRFLWKDWPKPVDARVERSGNLMLKWTVDPASAWGIVNGVDAAGGPLVVGPGGIVYFRANGLDCKVDGDAAGKTDLPIPKGEAFAVSADNRVVTGGGASTITVTSAGRTYCCNPAEFWLARPDGTTVMLDSMDHPGAVAVSPDGKWLAAFPTRHAHTGLSYRIQPDGTVDAKQRFYQLHVPDDAEDAGAAGACFDRDGHLYVATRMGVQVLDRNGRSRLILPMPGNAAAGGICFGGPKFDTLYATANGKLYRRHMKATGAAPFDPPITLPPWGAG
jgi:gluconolactonase